MKPAFGVFLRPGRWPLRPALATHTLPLVLCSASRLEIWSLPSFPFPFRACRPRAVRARHRHDALARRVPGELPHRHRRNGAHSRNARPGARTLPHCGGRGTGTTRPGARKARPSPSPHDAEGGPPPCDPGAQSPHASAGLAKKRAPKAPNSRNDKGTSPLEFVPY
jgi:hypothetical protein